MEFIEGFKIKYGYDLEDFEFKEFDLGDAHGREYIDSDGKPVAKLTVTDSIIANVFVYTHYRGYGLSYQLLDVAMDEYGLDTLTVDINNKVAIHAYESYGFKILYGNGSMYTMKFKGISVR